MRNALDLVGIPGAELAQKIIDLRRAYDDLDAEQMAELGDLTEEYVTRGKKDQPIFVYGTLADKAVQQWLWYDEFRGVKATLEGYEKKTYSNGIHYVVPNTDAQVEGMLYHVTPRQLSRADSYETSMYKRVHAKVKVAEAYVPAFVYAQNENYFEQVDKG